MPDSQAGHWCVGLSPFSGSEDKQRDTARECERAENWRYGNVVLLLGGSVNRSDIKNFLLACVREALTGKCKRAKNDEQNSKPCDWFHILSLRLRLRASTPNFVRCTVGAVGLLSGKFRPGQSEVLKSL